MTEIKHPAHKKAKKRMIIYLYVLIVLMSFLTVASYTWFTITRSPRVSNMSVYIVSNAGLEMSTDMEEWVLQLDFWDIIDATDSLDEEKENPVLRPVTWSEEQQSFFAAAYGLDGRLLSYKDWHVLSDDRHANKQNIENYYAKAVFYFRCGQNVDVTLSPAVEVNEGVDGSGTFVRGVPVWNPGHLEEQEDEEGNLIELLVGMGHDNGGQGAENAIRMGFRFTPYIENEEGEFVPDEEREPEFFIFEPNCDLHIDGSTDYIPTPSMDGTETLIDPEKLILQTATTWKDADPIEHGVVIHTLGELINPPTMFSLKSGEIMQVELYVWLEGQDIDCTNRASNAMIQANLQFAGKTEEQSGLVEIE